MTIKISVPYTDMVLACEALERSLELGFDLENIINDMFEEGYNMDIFFYDYDFERNFRK